MACCRSRSYSKQASEHATGVAAAAAAAADDDALPLLVPLAELEEWIAHAAHACNLPAVGPREEGAAHAVGGVNGGDALVRCVQPALAIFSLDAAHTAQVYGELSLSALASVLCEHADAISLHGARGGEFVDLGSGTGKSVLLAALCPFIASATGIEIVRSRHECAAALSERFQRTLLPRARPAGGVSLSLRCDSFLHDTAWCATADFVLCNCLLFPDALLAALTALLASGLRPGALVATVVMPLPSPVFRIVSVRHVGCSWGTADLLIHRRMEHGAAWQRRRALPCADGADGAEPLLVDELLSCDALRACGVLRRLRLHAGAADAAGSLLIVACGDSALPSQLASACPHTRVHACDLDADSLARQRAAAAAATPAALFAAADVCDLPLDDAAWDSEAAACADASSEDDEEEGPAPRVFEAVLDQCSLDVLPSLDGGRAALHAALCSLSACVAPGGVAALLSLRPPAEALPLLTAHPAQRWRVEAVALEGVSCAERRVYAYFCTRGDGIVDDADDGSISSWSAASARCSLAACGKVAFAQAWWECATCVQEAVCAACAARCHDGHALAPAPPPREGRPERGFCDCGFSGRCAAAGVVPLGEADVPLAPAGDRTRHVC